MVVLHMPITYGKCMFCVSFRYISNINSGNQHKSNTEVAAAAKWVAAVQASSNNDDSATFPLFTAWKSLTPPSEWDDILAKPTAKDVDMEWRARSVSLLPTSSR